MNNFDTAAEQAIFDEAVEAVSIDDSSSRNERVEALAAQQQQAADDALAALGDTEQAAAIAAVLAADEGDDNAREGREVAWFEGCDAVDTGSRNFEAAQFNVRKSARWQGVKHTVDGLEVHGPCIASRAITGQLIPAKLEAARAARQTELDKLAMPWLWKADRKRGSLKSAQGFNAARQRMLAATA